MPNDMGPFRVDMELENPARPGCARGQSRHGLTLGRPVFRVVGWQTVAWCHGHQTGTDPSAAPTTLARATTLARSSTTRRRLPFELTSGGDDAGGHFGQLARRRPRDAAAVVSGKVPRITRVQFVQRLPTRAPHAMIAVRPTAAVPAAATISPSL